MYTSLSALHFSCAYTQVGRSNYGESSPYLFIASSGRHQLQRLESDVVHNNNGGRTRTRSMNVLGWRWRCIFARCNSLQLRVSVLDRKRRCGWWDVKYKTNLVQNLWWYVVFASHGDAGSSLHILSNDQVSIDVGLATCDKGIESSCNLCIAYKIVILLLLYMRLLFSTNKCKRI